MHSFTQSEEVLPIFYSTRFATTCYVLELLMEVQAALRERIAYRQWIRWVTKNKVHALAATKCVASINLDLFWLKVDKIFTKPFM